MSIIIVIMLDFYKKIKGSLKSNDEFFEAKLINFLNFIFSPSKSL